MKTARGNTHPPIRDYGGEAVVLPIDHATTMNRQFRLALWTGQHLQLTLMCVPVGGEIGVEMHADTDQFLRIEAGCAKVCVGKTRQTLAEKAVARKGDVVVVPAGTWHNMINVGEEPLKLYSLYAPPHHPFGTVQPCPADGNR